MPYQLKHRHANQKHQLMSTLYAIAFIYRLKNQHNQEMLKSQNLQSNIQVQEFIMLKEQFQSEHQDLTFSSLPNQSPFKMLISHLKHKPLPISRSSHQPSIADWQKQVLSPLESSDISECQNLSQMISKRRMPANMTSPLQTHSFQMKPWMKKKAEWWSYYCLGPRSHLSKEIRSYSWIWPTCPLEVREAFLHEFTANLPNVVRIFR